MKNDAIRRIIGRILILLAIVLLCWPAASHIHSAVKAVNMTNDASTANSPENEEYADLIEAARRYNDSLDDVPLRYPLTEEEMEAYMSLMNISGNGVMGRISIPKISVALPIYHDATDKVMQEGIGHMPGSSLPVISDRSHVVLAGHRGLATLPMFTDLPELEIGDRFEITSLRQTLTYEVDKIITVLPEEVNVITIEDGKEYCTLITCTPIGINSHRLLVRGHRIETAEEATPATEAPKNAAVLRDVFRGKVLTVYEVVLLGLALILLIVGLIWPCGIAIFRKIRKNRGNRA